jgi:AraC-like DNA-binding protein
MLGELVMEASAAFETDRRKAKFCIQQATELLQAKQSRQERRQVEFPIVRDGLAHWQARRVAAYIESNICSKISVIELAALVHLSIGHFCRAFKVSFGASPLAYVMRERMLRAQEMMASSEAPLSRIALECGMCDQAHFSHTFRRIIRVSPTSGGARLSHLDGLRRVRSRTRTHVAGAGQIHPNSLFAISATARRQFMLIPSRNKAYRSDPASLTCRQGRYRGAKHLTARWVSNIRGAANDH